MESINNSYKNSKVQNIVLYLSLFFSGSNCFALISPIFKVLTAGVVITIVILTIPSMIVKFSKIMILLLLTLFTYLFFVLISNAFNQELNIFNTGVKIIIYFLLFFYLLSRKSRDIFYLLDFHNQVLFFVCFVGCIGFILSFFISLPTLITAFASGRKYEYNLFLWTIEDAKLNVNGIVLFRLQCCFDEPGTFAFLVLPSFFYSIYKKKYFETFIFFSSVLFSFSIGAMMLEIIALVYIIIKNKKYNILIIILGLMFFLLYKFDFWEFILNYLQMKLGIGKFAGTYSSGGIRANEYDSFFDILVSNPFGITVTNLLKRYGFCFSVSFLRELACYGIGGAVFRIFFEIVLYIIVFRIARKNLYLTLGLFSLVLMGYQRMTIIQTYYCFFIFILFFLFGDENYEKGRI